MKKFVESYSEYISKINEELSITDSNFLEVIKKKAFKDVYEYLIYPAGHIDGTEKIIANIIILFIAEHINDQSFILKLLDNLETLSDDFIDEIKNYHSNEDNNDLDQYSMVANLIDVKNFGLYEEEGILSDEFISYFYDIYDLDIDFKYLINNYKSSFIPLIKKIVPVLIEKIYEMLDLDLTYSGNDYVEIYRGISVDEEEWFDKLKKGEVKRLGIYWTYDKDVTTNFSTHVVFTARVPFKQIDWVDTILQKIMYGETEQEIRLYKNTPIDLLSIEVNWRELDIDNLDNMKFIA